MSNEAKSRIMLWLFILFCCLCSFFAGRVAKADSITATTDGTIQVSFNLPAGNSLRCR